MRHPLLRKGLLSLNALLGISAVAGGAALIAGWISMPLNLLAGSPFSDYTIPGLLLMVVVGGSGLAAAWFVHVHADEGVIASAVAGGAIIIFEIVELNVIGFSWLLAIYIGIGVVILVVAAFIEVDERPVHLPQRRLPQAR